VTKKEMARNLQGKLGVETIKRAEEILDVVLDVITETVANGEEVRLSGFGTFSRVEKEARQGHNPATMEKITIPAKKVVKFKVAKALAESVNE
jgi:nucleoid DNA-binding protein